MSSLFLTPDVAKMTKQDKYPYRVVLVHPSAGVNWSGGSEIFAIELANQLSCYFDVELLSGAPYSALCYPAGGIPRTRAYQLVRHPLIASILKPISTHPEILIEHLTSFLPSAFRLLRHPADLIFPCNDYAGLAMAALVRAIRGTPILFTEHLSLMAGGRLLQRNLRFRPDQLVTLSAPVAEFVYRINPTQAVSVIPNGVDLSRFKSEGSQLQLHLPRSIVLCVASLKRGSHKRVELLIDAMKHLPQASLLLCGDGPDRAHFQALGETAIGSKRFAICSVPFDRMPEVYRSADVFTLPSVDEPFGLAYVEAMASGLPVVATDDEMRQSIVGNAGILCDVTDPIAYANALETALYRNWGNSSQQNASRFSWETLSKQYRDVILEVIARSYKRKLHS